MRLFEFGDAPESVTENVAEMSAIMEQRRRGNEAVQAKNDTERYLVLVFSDRAAREAAALSIGLPHDERYVHGSAVELRLRSNSSAGDVQVAAARECSAADVSHSGAGG